MLRCDERDDYLDDTLSPKEHELFRLHLDACTSCRDFVESQQRIQRMLREATRVVPPVGLKFRIERHIQIAPRRRRAVTVSLTAAAAALCLYFSIAKPLSQAPLRARRPSPQAPDIASAPYIETVQGESSEATAIAASPALTDELSPPQSLVTVDTDDNVIAVRRPSKHANVSVYLLYPTVRTAASAPPDSNELQDSASPENAL